MLLPIGAGGLILVLVLLPSNTARWEQATDAGIQAYTHGHSAEATHSVETALREAASFGPADTRLATSLNTLAALAMAQGQYPRAEPFFQRALAMLEQTLGSEHPVMVTSLENDAALLRWMDCQTEAGTLETCAHAIRAKHAMANRATTSVTLVGSSRDFTL